MLAVMGTSTCHVMNGDDARRGARGCAASSTAASRRACSATRPVRAASATSSPGSSSSSCRPRYHDEARAAGPRPARVPLRARGAPGAGRARARRARLAQRQPLRARRPRAERRRSSGSRSRTRPEDIYRALIEATAFGARTIVETFEASGVPVREFTVAGGLVKNPFADADLRGRAAPAAPRGRLRQGPALGSAIHAAVAAGLLRGHPRCVGGDGQGAPRRATCPTPAPRIATTSCTRTTRALHDHFGAAAAR